MKRATLAILTAMLLPALAGAQSVSTRKAGAPSRDSTPRVSDIVQNSVAIYPFATALNANSALTVILSQLARQTVTSVSAANVWTVLDRSADRVLAAEMEKVTSPDNFNSSITVDTRNATNARFLLLGFLDDARANSENRAGKWVYSATLALNVALYDVEQRKVVRSTSISVSSLQSDPDALKQRSTTVIKKRGLKIVTDQACKAFGGNCEDKRKTAAVDDVVTDAVYSPTENDAFLRASETAGKKIRTWIVERSAELTPGARP